jgi:hypothetical protein
MYSGCPMVLQWVAKEKEMFVMVSEAHGCMDKDKKEKGRRFVAVVVVRDDCERKLVR